MSAENKPPIPVTTNNPFNRVEVSDNENGTTVIVDSPFALLVLSFLSIVMLFQLIRLHKENRGLKKRCSCDCECCQGCKDKTGGCTCDCERCKCCKHKREEEECRCADCACEDA